MSQFRIESAKRMRKRLFREGPRNVLDYEKLIQHYGDGIYFHVEPAGKGFFHVLSVEEILDRINQQPHSHLNGIHCVVLPRMTRKRQRLNIYGLAWGSTVYLYPSPEDRLHVYENDIPNVYRVEARKYGAKIIEEGNTKAVQWTDESLRHYYLENVLLHELAHTYDCRNTRLKDREAFAEAYVQKYGSKHLPAVKVKT